LKCPVCQNKISYENKICLFCNRDIIISRKILVLSNRFYNKALREAKSQRLSDAIISLKKSICLYKKNIHARNLLGLIYFKIGYISDALRHWIISASFDKNKNNKSKSYLEIMQKNNKFLDLCCDSIDLYNSGLEFINNHNDDLGVIKLKKSLELNPNFIDAINLIALCYIYQKKILEAKKMLERALSLDKSNQISLRYYKIICKQDFDCEKKIYVNKKNKFRNKIFGLFSFASLSVFIFGIIFSMIINYGLFFPSEIKNKNKNIEYLSEKLSLLEENYNNLEKKYLEDMPKLEQANQDLTKENLEFNKIILEQKIRDGIDQANELLNAQKIQEAAEVLYKINIDGVEQSDLLNELEVIKNKIYSRAANLYFENGYKDYKNKNYESSREKFEKSLLYSNGIIDDKLNYYLGLVNQELKKIYIAKSFYEKVIKNYPDSKFFDLAQQRLEEIKNYINQNGEI